MRKALVVIAIMTSPTAIEKAPAQDCVNNPCLDSSPFIFCTKPNTMPVGGKCIDITALPEGGPSISAAPMPTCPQGYALLTYPGTWTPICARDLRAPK